MLWDIHAARNGTNITLISSDFQYDFLILFLLHTYWPENGSSPVQIASIPLEVTRLVLI